MFREQNLKFNFVFTLMRNFRIVTDFKYARFSVSNNVIDFSTMRSAQLAVSTWLW